MGPEIDVQLRSEARTYEVLGSRLIPDLHVVMQVIVREFGVEEGLVHVKHQERLGCVEPGSKRGALSGGELIGMRVTQ